MTLHTEGPTDATRTLLALISASVKWQGAKLTHRTYLHCYTLTLKDQREKLREQSQLPLHQKEQNTQG